MPVYRRPLRSYELYHSGKKGMRWGVRNGPPYPIDQSKTKGFPVSLNVKSKDGIVVKSISKHAKEQAEKRGVKPEHLIDAITNPLYIGETKYNTNGLPSKNFIGKYATACVNPENGKVATVYPTSSKRVRKYSKGG